MVEDLMKTIISLLLLFALPTSFVGQSRLTAESRPVVFNRVTVIDMTGEPPKANMTVVVVGDRISAIGQTGTIRLPQNAQIINGTGKFLIPGLWDMHVHVLNSDRMLPLFVANGVLGVRDLGVHNIDEILRFREESATGKIISPRIVTAGKVLDGEPQADPAFSTLIKTPAEGRKAARDLRAKGVDCIKVYDVLSRASYFAIADEAKKLRLPFVGHVPTAVTTIEASDAGQKSIEHLGKIIEDSSGSPEKVREIQKASIKDGDYFAFTTRIGRVYDALIATYDDKKAKEIFAHFRKNKTWQVPTLSVKYGRTFIDELDAKGDPNSKYVEASQVSYWKPAVGFFSRYRTPSYIAEQKIYFQKELDLVGDMYRAGVPVMAGTDTPNAYVIAGFSLHDELALLVKAGLTPMEALQTATISPVKFLGLEKSLGTIEKGKLADLVLLEVNPLEHIANTKKISAVVVNGRYLSKEILQRMLADVESVANKN